MRWTRKYVMQTFTSERSSVIDLDKLYHVVQQNCHISDGRYAQAYGLCTYLLKMRELYRWEKALPFTASLPHDKVGHWLAAREQLWEELADETFTCLPIRDDCYDPFDTNAINQVLLPQGIVYSGGYGQFCKPLFFVGDLAHYRQEAGLHIFIVGKEYVRDLIAPAAMAQGSCLFIRQECLKRLLWEKIEEWRFKKANTYFSQILTYYQAEENMEAALERMSCDEIPTLIDHEKGEIKAGDLLGQTWEEMLSHIAGSQAEWIVRAVRDHLADCLVTLPNLLEKTQFNRLLFYFINLKGLRKTLFPTLVKTCQQWLDDGQSGAALQHAIKQGQQHWLNTAQALLALYQTHPDRCATLIQQRLEDMIL